MMKNKVFIIAEAGSNWKTRNGRDLEQAYALIDAAAEAGADAVKFQVFSASPVYVENAGTSDYLSKNGITRPINDIFREMAMPHSMLPKLARRCREKKIEFMASAFSEPDFKAVDPFVKRHKIASYEISYGRLLELAARSKKPLILSTGASDHSDISWAISHFRKHGGRSLSLMQCTAKYPARPESLNLRVIPELTKRYRVPAGFSDHSLDALTAPVAAVALGATIIEKHFTLNRKLAGPDHAFAIEPTELAAMVRVIRDCEKALGSNRKAVIPDEKELRDYAQRAVQATRDIAKGEEIRDGVNVAVLRPGKQTKGVHPRHLSKIQGRRARRFIRAGCGIREAHYA